MRGTSLLLSALLPCLACVFHTLVHRGQFWTVRDICWISWQECSLLMGHIWQHGYIGLRPDADLHDRPSASAALAAIPLPEQRLAKVLPLAPVHVPKCGSTFGNALLRLPGACPALSANELLCDSGNPTCDVKAFLARHGFPDSVNLSLVCSGTSRSWGTHEGFGSDYESLKGHLVTVLRRPEQQLISGFLDNFNSWPFFFPRPRTLQEYLENVQGLSVKMLTRDGRAHPVSNCVYDFARPTPAETRLAVRRLREGFAFVGILERFELSICLFHKIFGGECHGSELGVFHPGPFHSGKAYDTAGLLGFKDVYGGAVYEEANRIFEESLAAFNVSLESCEESCFRQARGSR